MSTEGFSEALEGIGFSLSLLESPLFFYSFILSYYHFQLLRLLLKQ
jgi:hypothetical protein